MSTATMEVIVLNEEVQKTLQAELPAHQWQVGDTKLIWSKDNPDEIEQAKITFDNLTKKGFAAFSVVGKEGNQGEKVTKFDPKAERLILVPPMKGG